MRQTTKIHNDNALHVVHPSFVTISRQSYSARTELDVIRVLILRGVASTCEQRGAVVERVRVARRARLFEETQTRLDLRIPRSGRSCALHGRYE